MMLGPLPARADVDVTVLEGARRLPAGLQRRHRPQWSDDSEEPLFRPPNVTWSTRGARRTPDSALTSQDGARTPELSKVTVRVRFPSPAPPRCRRHRSPVSRDIVRIGACGGRSRRGRGWGRRGYFRLSSAQAVAFDDPAAPYGRGGAEPGRQQVRRGTEPAVRGRCDVRAEGAGLALPRLRHRRLRAAW